MDINYSKMGLTSISVFEIEQGGESAWVIRHFGLLGTRLGDKIVYDEPTDEWLAETYGQDVTVVRGYQVVGDALYEYLQSSYAPVIKQDSDTFVGVARDADGSGGYILAFRSEGLDLKIKLDSEQMRSLAEDYGKLAKNV